MESTSGTCQPSQRKTKQINVRVTEEQALLLKQYCVRHALPTNEVVLTALCAMIKGFEKA